MKYKIICRNCLKKFGETDKPDAELPTKCDECNGTQIAMVENRTTEAEQLDFDILIVNKRTNVSKRCGFFISKEVVEKNKKNLNKMRAIMATEIASAISMIVKPDALLVDLLKGVE